MQGRKRKPGNLKLVTGNPGKRPIPVEVAPVRGMPENPPHLCAEAQAEWRRVCADMEAIGTLGMENRTVLAIYCQNWARLVLAEAHVNEHGPIVPAPRTGVPMHNPYLGVANKASEMVGRLAAELGLTPAARSRVTGKGKAADADDPWAKLANDE